MGTIRWQFEAGKLLDAHIVQIQLFLDGVPDIDRIGIAAGEYIQGHEAEIGIGVGGAVAFVQHDDGRKTSRRVLPKLVAYLGDDRRAGFFGRARHDVEHEFVVQTKIARDVMAIDQEVFSLGQCIKPPV